MARIISTRRLVALFAAIAAMMATPLAAQPIEQVDPNEAIDGDLVENPGEPSVYGTPATQPQSQPQAPAQSEPQSGVSAWTDLSPETDAPAADQPQAYSQNNTAPPAVPAASAETWQDDDLIGAAQD